MDDGTMTSFKVGNYVRDTVIYKSFVIFIINSIHDNTLECSIVYPYHHKNAVSLPPKRCKVSLPGSTHSTTIGTIMDTLKIGDMCIIKGVHTIYKIVNINVMQMAYETKIIFPSYKPYSFISIGFKNAIPISPEEYIRIVLEN